MYTRHFLKMFLWLIVMGLLGIAGLVIANHYSKTGKSVFSPSSSTTSGESSEAASNKAKLPTPRPAN